MTLRILYWNVWCLPRILTDDRYSARMRATLAVHQIKDYDLVILNEVWLKGARDVFIKAYPYHFTLPRAPFKIMNSGILILSKYPILNVDYEIYQDAAGWNWFTSKGMVYFQIQTKQNKYSIVTTHMQSGTFNRARLKQSRQLIDFINRHGEDNLMLVGNLNLMPLYSDGGKSIYCTDMKDAINRAKCYHSILNMTGMVDIQPNGDVCRIFSMSRDIDLEIKYGRGRHYTNGLPITIEWSL